MRFRTLGKGLEPRLIVAIDGLVPLALLGRRSRVEERKGNADHRAVRRHLYAVAWTAVDADAIDALAHGPVDVGIAGRRRAGGHPVGDPGPLLHLGRDIPRRRLLGQLDDAL